MAPAAIPSLLLASLLLAGCSMATLEQVEEVGNPAPSDPDLDQGQYSLDDDLCWQGAQPPSGAPADQGSIRAAHDACMRKQGWAVPAAGQ
jgi:hypothetical protein